jgi:hypothetical protein
VKRYWIELRSRVHTGTGAVDVEVLETHLEELMDVLMDEPGAIDPDLTATLTTGQVIISMAIDAESDGEALERALVIARSAVHKTGGFTPKWTQAPEGQVGFDEGFDASVRLADFSAC